MGNWLGLGQTNIVKNKIGIEGMYYKFCSSGSDFHQLQTFDIEVQIITVYIYTYIQWVNKWATQSHLYPTGKFSITENSSNNQSILKHINQ